MNIPNEKDLLEELLEAKALLQEAIMYIDNTHGYDTELFKEIKDFLEKDKKKVEYHPPF